ncbi:MAG: DUF3488 and DUF4129 domain-containing transglutaminase family protein [Halobacteriaceae archaeon]
MSVRSVVRNPGSSLLQLAALANIAVVTGTWLSVLYGVVEVVGGSAQFIFFVGGAVVVGAVFASTLTHRQALALSAGLLALGLAGYLNSVPPTYWAAMSPSRFVADMVALLTGFSVFRMTNAGTWALAVGPGPAFLATYFAVRREYVRSAAVSAVLLGFFVLTGDANTMTTMLGVVGVTAALGFSALARHGGSQDQVETLAAALAVMVLASATVTAVPGSAGTPLLPNAGSSIQADLVRADDRADVGGSIRLSPEVRFVVDSEREAYWRVAAYDRYTGSGWIRTGSNQPLDQPRDRPPGDRASVTQTFTAKSTLDVFAAAARPQSVSNAEVAVTAQGTLDLTETLRSGDQYRVQSLVPDAPERTLRQAGDDYPDWVEDAYLQVPETTGKRVARLTANITEGANSDYARAERIEQWLSSTKEYDTSVTDPGGSVAESFLFEMESGYCVYFATTMVTMLRTQGIPARYVVGYTSGQQVDGDTYVVRGYDSHAWVEMYVPNQGWVRFDPTPSEPRREAETAELEAAREAGREDVDAAGSQNATSTPTSTPTATVGGGAGPTLQRTLFTDRGGIEEGNGTTLGPSRPLPDDPAAVGGGEQNDGGGGEQNDGGGGGLPVPRLPPLNVLAIWSVIGVGLTAGARRSGFANRAYRSVWLRWQPRTDDPTVAVEGAFARVEYVIEQLERERRPGETVREYIDDVNPDERAATVAAIRERARYGGTVTEDEAAEARRLADAYVSERVGVATLFNRLLS